MKFSPFLVYEIHYPLLSQTPKQRSTMLEFLTMTPSEVVKLTVNEIFLSL